MIGPQESLSILDPHAGCFLFYQRIFLIQFFRLVKYPPLLLEPVLLGTFSLGSVGPLNRERRRPCSEGVFDTIVSLQRP
jgi:hypothetical protein